LYIGVICFDDEPENILVSQSRRDADLDDTDSIQILLDTFNDGQNAFVFGTNPFGIEYDGQVMAEGQAGQGNRGGFNLDWDANWVVRTGMTERGWEAEFAIPLKTLRYSAGQERTWGINAMRNIRRKNEQVFLAPVPRGYNLHRVSVAGKLHGLSLPARRDLKLRPSTRDWIRLWRPPAISPCCGCNAKWVDRTSARCSWAARGMAAWRRQTITTGRTGSISAGRRQPTVG
jgi:hypothetical protein